MATRPKIPPLSAGERRKIAVDFKDFCGVPRDLAFVPIAGMAENGLARWYPDFEFHIEPNGTMGNRLAYVAIDPLRLVTDENGYLSLHRHNGRMRFTIAHEIAHALAHIEFLKLIDSLPRNEAARLLYVSPVERQADQIAAELLMSEQVARACDTPTTLARVCGVSFRAAELRMKGLGLWPKPDPDDPVKKGFNELLKNWGKK